MDELLKAITSISASLNAMAVSQDASIGYDGMSGALLWSDEMPLKVSYTHVELLAFRVVLRFRTTVIIGEANMSYQLYWEAAQQAFPRWPGFLEDRCQYSSELKSLFLEKEAAFERALDAANDPCIS